MVAEEGKEMGRKVEEWNCGRSWRIWQLEDYGTEMEAEVYGMPRSAK
jgi:hypothetical protein